jgi:hypothetical protein
MSAPPITATLVTPRPVRWTLPCPQPAGSPGVIGDGPCGGYLLSAKGNSSWKRGDFPAGGEITARCSACGGAAVVERP